MIFPIDIKYLSACHKAAYPADNGCDIGCPVGTPIVAVGDGTIIYSEPGHSRIYPDGPNDTRNAVKIMLDTPVMGYNRAFYTHLSQLAFTQHRYEPVKRRVKQGEYLGKTGIGRNSKHLHFSLYKAHSEDYFPPMELQDYLWGPVLADQMIPKPPKQEEDVKKDAKSFKLHSINLATGKSEAKAVVLPNPVDFLEVNTKTFGDLVVAQMPNRAINVHDGAMNIVWQSENNAFDIAGVLNVSRMGSFIHILYAYF